MFVPSYQMHNILNIYSNKLRRNITSGKKQNTPDTPPVDRITLTLDGKRQATIEKVSKDIFDKITRFGSQAESSQWMSDRIKGKLDEKPVSAKMDTAGFVFNVIDPINQKTTNTVSVEDPNFLIRRIERLLKNTRAKSPNYGTEDQEIGDNPAI